MTDGRERTWWTRQRVLAGLRRFHQETGLTPTSMEEYYRLVGRQHRNPVHNRYPTFYGVLRWFPSFRQAWRAVGVHTDRNHEQWTEVEDWYLREAIGLYSRIDIARELDRTPQAVHTRVNDLGLHSYQARGWTLHRVERCTSVPRHLLDKYLERGEVAYVRGNKCIFVDPADLLAVEEIDWTSPPPELEQAVRRALAERLVHILTGADWRQVRPHRPNRVLITGRKYRWALVKPTPKPAPIEPGHRVRCIAELPEKGVAIGRTGLVHTVYFKRQGAAGWVARVEFKKKRMAHGTDPRVTYTIPLEALQRVGAA